MFPLNQIAHVGVSQSRGLKLLGREVILEEFQPMSSRYQIVTDGQMDRQTDESNLITALCTSASRGKNYKVQQCDRSESDTRYHVTLPQNVFVFVK